jgi:hypothetical protein
MALGKKKYSLKKINLKKKQNIKNFKHAKFRMILEV